MALIAPVPRTGAASLFAYASEAGMLSPEDSAAALDSTLTLAMVGYTNSPGYTRPNALAEVRSAGMRAVAKYVGGRPEPVQSVTMTLGDAAGVYGFLQQAFASEGAGTHMCMPVIASAVAYLNQCGASGQAYQRLGRYGQINRLSVNFRLGQPVTASVEIWPLYINPSGGATMPTVTPAAIRTAGGEVFMYADAALSFGSDDYTAHLRSFTITIDNLLTREGQRPYSQGGWLARAPGSVYSLGQRTSLQLEQADALPVGLLDGADNGAFTAVMTLGAVDITFTSTASFVDVESQAEGEPASPLGYGTSIMLPDLAISSSHDGP